MRPAWCCPEITRQSPGLQILLRFPHEINLQRIAGIVCHSSRDRLPQHERVRSEEPRFRRIRETAGRNSLRPFVALEWSGPARSPDRTQWSWLRWPRERPEALREFQLTVDPESGTALRDLDGRLSS